MKRRDFLRALVALPVAAAAAPLLKLVPEAAPAITPWVFWDEAALAYWVANPRRNAYITGLTVPDFPIAPMLAGLPLIEDPLCPPGRIYLLPKGTA